MKQYVDSYQHKGLRKRLVDLLRTKGITDERVLDAINAIPRHFFLDSAFDLRAYEDKAFPIEADQTISQPYTVAYQTQLLQVKKSEKVLEIGTGSIYQSSVLAIQTLEKKSARKNLERQCRNQINRQDSKAPKVLILDFLTS